MARQEPQIEQEPLVLKLNVDMEEAGDEEVDLLTRQLLREIEDIHVESARLEDAGEIPAGAKGDAVNIGSIVVSVLPTALPALVGLVSNWIDRSKGRTVKFKGEIRGAQIEYEGTAEDLKTLLAEIGKQGPPAEPSEPPDSAA